MVLIVKWFGILIEYMLEYILVLRFHLVAMIHISLSNRLLNSPCRNGNYTLTMLEQTRLLDHLDGIKTLI